MLRAIVPLIVFFASFFSCMESYSFSTFDEDKINVVTREKISKNSNKFDFVNRVYLETISEQTYDASDNQNELLRTSARNDLVSQIYYNKKWFSYVNFRFQEEGLDYNEFASLQVAPENGGDQFYSNHSGVVREMNFGYEDDDYKFYVGKFRAKFGYAWNLGRGMFSNALASSYMQTERLGFGAEIKSGNKRTVGAYNLGLALYKYDRKFLDNSLFQSRREISASDTVPSDTKNPRSFTVNLDVDFDFDSGRELFYRFAYSKQKMNEELLASKYSGQGRFGDQKSYSLAMNYKTIFSDNFALDSLIEYVDTDYAEGNFATSKDNVVSVSLISNIYKNWNVTTALSQRRVASNTDIALKTMLAEVSAGYVFKNSGYFDGLQIQLGVTSFRNTAPTTSFIDNRQGVAAMVRYVKWI